MPRDGAAREQRHRRLAQAEIDSHQRQAGYSLCMISGGKLGQRSIHRDPYLFAIWVGLREERRPDCRPRPGLADQALVIARLGDDERWNDGNSLLVGVLQLSGLISELLDDLDGARVSGQEALDIYRSSGDRRHEATQLTNLDRLAWKQKDFDTALTG